MYTAIQARNIVNERINHTYYKLYRKFARRIVRKITRAVNRDRESVFIKTHKADELYHNVLEQLAKEMCGLGYRCHIDLYTMNKNHDEWGLVISW